MFVIVTASKLKTVERFSIGRSYWFNYSRCASTAVNLSKTEFAFKNTDNALPPIVILHGLLGSKTNWKSLASTIAQRTKHRVITLDARNHGESPHTDDTSYSAMVADVLNFVKNENIEQFTVVGHSMGGRTAMLTALQNPNIVNKLIVVDIAPMTYKGEGLNSTQQVLTAMKVALNEVKGNLTLSEARRIVDKSLSQTLSELSLRQFILTNLVEKNGAITWRVNLDLLEQNYKNIMVFPETSGQFTGPTLVIGGSKSDYIKPDAHPVIRKYFPNASIEYVNDAGHWVHAEKPTEFLNLVIPFIN